MKLVHIVCWIFWHRITVSLEDLSKPHPWDLRCERCGKRIVINRREP
jgi:DNA-directed RNA polymerase subunit RPC12/RpoP